MREAILARGEVSLHTVLWEGPGREAPPVVLLHGLSSNSYFWSRLAGLLPRRTVIAYDQRAHGASSAPDSGYSPAELAADAALVVESVTEGPVVVAGHSWGGTIALQLAADRPDLVSGLALIDSPTGAFSGLMSWEQAQEVMQPPLPVYASAEEAARASRPHLATDWDADLDSFIAHGLVQQADGWRLPLTASIRLQILEAMFFQDYDALWGRVSMPVWVALARGGRQGAFYQAKLENARRLAATVPGLEVEWFDTGHDIPIEDAAGVAAGLERLAVRASASG